MTQEHPSTRPNTRTHDLTQDTAQGAGRQHSDAVTTPHRLDEATYDELREIAARYPQARSGLLPMLHLVQSVEGRITPAGIEACAELLDITAAEVSGVATFYTMYKRHPVGDYHVGVCTNTLCAIMGGDQIFDRVSRHLGIGNDETTPSGQSECSVSLERVECNAACDYAPVMMVNWEFMDNMTPESAVRLVDALRAGEQVRSTRGPTVCTWRQAERVIAGFPDDRADEGPAAGPASLLGLEIARAHDWHAPQSPERERTAEDPGEAARRDDGPTVGSPESPESTQSARAGVQEADTGRAGSETEVADSAAETKHETGGDQ